MTDTPTPAERDRRPGAAGRESHTYRIAPPLIARISQFAASTGRDECEVVEQAFREFLTTHREEERGALQARLAALDAEATTAA